MGKQEEIENKLIHGILNYLKQSKLVPPEQVFSYLELNNPEQVSIDSFFENLKKGDSSLYSATEILKSKKFLKKLKNNKEVQEYFFKRFLEQENKILKHEVNKNYLSDDLYKIIVSQEGNNLDGILIEIKSDENKLTILTPELKMETWKYDSKGDLREEMDRSLYF